MGSTCRHISPKENHVLRAAVLALLGLWLFCAGGCAMLPFAITTTASFAMPPTASLAMTGVKSAYSTAYLASDERDMNTIVRDNMLSLKAQSALLTAQGSSDVHAYAYNGEVFAVGVVNTQDDRDRIIRAMQNVKGVGAIKGHIRLRDPEYATEQLADNSLENHARRALSRHLLHKNAGIEVQAVQGQLCLMGVVGTHAEALDIIQYVESMTGARALSLLSIRNEYATGRTQTNRLYLLEPGEPTAPRLTLQDAPSALPNTRIQLADRTAENPAGDTPYSSARATLASAPASNTFRAPIMAARSLRAPAIAPGTNSGSYRATVTPPAPALNKARAFVQHRLTTMAKAEANPQARTELLALADHVAQDRDLSISDRLSVAAAQATQQQAKAKIQALLALY